MPKLVWLCSPSRDLLVGGDGGAIGGVLGLELLGELLLFLSNGRHLSLVVLTLEDNLDILYNPFNFRRFNYP